MQAKGILLHRWKDTETMLVKLLKTVTHPQRIGYHIFFACKFRVIL